jgi:transposase
MSLKIEHLTQTVNSSDQLLCCFDVSKASLSLYTEYQYAEYQYADQPEPEDGRRASRIEEEIPNQTGAIEQLLARLEGLAEEIGLRGLCVLAEPTGGFERKLLDTARRLGHETGLINPEHVSKLKTVESNDTGKTDHKDPRVMHLIARLGKTQTDRHLPETYHRLRRLTRYYDEDEETLTAARQRIHAVISELFPDYDKSATFTFGTTGQALMDAYAFDPYHIQRAGLGRFKNTLRRRVGARTSTLEHLFERAEESARYHKTEAEVELLVDRLKALWADYRRLTARRTALRAQIEAIGEELLAGDELPELDHLKGITLFNLARLVGQTGPLEDFRSRRALLRYAGLNLRERQSGTYRGQTRLSKKGRPLLRKILGQTIFPVLRKAMLYGPYYHRKLQEGMVASKAKVAVMRKFLCMLHSLVRSGDAFDPERFRQCESQYALAR